MGPWGYDTCTSDRNVILSYFLCMHEYPSVSGGEGHAVLVVEKVRAPGPRRQERPRLGGHDAQDRGFRTRKVR